MYVCSQNLGNYKKKGKKKTRNLGEKDFEENTWWNQKITEDKWRNRTNSEVVVKSYYKNVKTKK